MFLSFVFEIIDWLWRFSSAKFYHTLHYRGVMIAPTAAEYLSQAWRGAVVLSFIWFLHRWKTNFFTVALTNVTNQTSPGLDRDKLLTLEKLSSVGLIILGVMGLAEALGVPVQSIVTVGGIGGMVILDIG